MIYIVTILILANLALTIALYAKMRTSKQSDTENVKIAQSEEKQPQTDEELDTKADLAERRFMEGMNAVLSYDFGTMKEYIKGVNEE